MAKSTTAWDAALRLLASRAHTRVELTTKLRQKGHSQPEIEAALDRAVELRLMEKDSDVAIRYAEELAKKPRSTPAWATAKLRERGIEEALIAGAVGRAFGEWDAREAALKTVGREEDPARAARRLQRKGFSTDIIAWVVERLRASAEQEG